MRRASFLLLFLVLGSLLLVTAPVRAAGESYYGVYVEPGGYIKFPISLSSDSYTFVIIARDTNVQPYTTWGEIYIYPRFSYGYGDLTARDRIFWHVKDTQSVTEAYVTDTSREHIGRTNLYVAMVHQDETTKTVDTMFYINTRLVGSGTFSGYLGNLTFFSIGDGYHKTSVEVFFVYVYSKLLSEQEIQQIYDNPWNPPTDGLAAWYAPDSVDTANNVWKDKLGNFDATIAVAYDYIRLSTISKFTESHVASFNGTGYFSVVNVSQSLNITNQITVEALVRLKEKVYNFEWIAEGPGWQFRSVTDGNYAIGFWIYNGTSWEPRVQWAYDDGLLGSWLDLIVTYDGSYLKLYVNGKLVASTVRTGDIDVPALYFKIGRAFTGDIAYVRVWSRSLNSTEIREIYEHPLDPPKDGLVLFYSPYSYDPTSGKWLNIAPIFPTVPLAEELDAQNYGAEAVRVSIPQLAVYDIENNSEIPISNVSVSMLANNTTISLVPSLLTLPWNSTVTLNVSASGYLPRLLQTPTSITSLAVYLYPAPSENSTTTPPNWTNNFTMPDINGTGWSGWQIGKEALSLNFDKAIQLFFTQNPNSKAQAFLPFAIWLGMTVLGLVFSQSPLVALTLGVITQASLAGLGAKLDMRLLPGVVTLYLFLFIWILKDFIESRKAD